MGPELAAMDKVMYHSSDLYIHEFTLKNSLLLKNAIEDIEKSDEKYLLQTYRQWWILNIWVQTVKPVLENQCVTKVW